MPLPLNFDFINSIIEVPAPDSSLDMQFLIDQIRDAEDELVWGLEYHKIADAAGKDDLGGGMQTAITVRLLDNWRIRFEARPGPGVEQMIISGGNLVGGPGGVPVAPSAFTQVVQQSSSAGVIATPSTVSETTNLRFLMTSLMGSSHKAIGNMFYWDPVLGSDSNSGLSPSLAVRTFAAAHDLVNSGANDIIFCLASDPSGITTVTEFVTISKNNVKLKGPGYIFQLRPTLFGQDTIVITGTNVEVSGMFISTAPTGNRSGIRLSGADNSLVSDCWISGTRLNGLHLSNTKRAKIETTVIEQSGLSGAGDGVLIENSSIQTNLDRCIIADHARDGLSLEGASTADTQIHDCLVYNNIEYGIDVGVGVLRTTARGGTTVTNNTIANTRDQGIDTYFELADTTLNAQTIADAVWDEVITGHLAANTAGKLLKDAKVKATLASMG